MKTTFTLQLADGSRQAEEVLYFGAIKVELVSKSLQDITLQAQILKVTQF